jgi:integrase
MSVDLSRVKDRDALPARREPHWQRIRPKCFLGYRPSSREGLGNWIARAYDEDAHTYRLKAIGDFGKLPGRDRFTVAKQEAEAFADFIEAGGFFESSVETVGDACKRYAGTNYESNNRFKRFVYSDPIAAVKLAKLRRRDLLAWRRRMEEKPAFVTRRKKGAIITRLRAPATVNREMSMVRAALNKVLAHGTPDTERAWQEALRPIRNASRQRTLYLDRDQRRTLLQQVSPEVEPFVRTLCLLPLRPGAVAHLTAGDFDRRTFELTIGKDKSGKPRRILVPLEVGSVLAEQTKDKLPGAHLFIRANGKPWTFEFWGALIKKAVVSGGLPPGTTAYTLRHSTITDLVNGGLPLLTVGQISDTSAEMIEKHYGHLCRHAATEALATLAL